MQHHRHHTGCDLLVLTSETARLPKRSQPACHDFDHKASHAALWHVRLYISCAISCERWRKAARASKTAEHCSIRLLVLQSALGSVCPSIGTTDCVPLTLLGQAYKQAKSKALHARPSPGQHSE